MTKLTKLTKLFVVLFTTLAIFTTPAMAADENPVQPAALGGAATAATTVSNGYFTAVYPEKPGCAKATVESEVWVTYRWYYNTTCDGRSDVTHLKLKIKDANDADKLWMADVSEPEIISNDEWHVRWQYNGQDNVIKFHRK